MRASLKQGAFVLSVAFGLLVALFVAGATFDDPGGWKAVGLVALWLVPLTALSVAAYRGPAWIRPVFLAVAVAVAVVAMHAAAAVDPSWWDKMENQRGPIRAIVSFAAAIPIAVYGRRAPLFAGTLLLGIAVAPIAMTTFVARSAPLIVMGLPIAFIGCLYLLSGHTEGRAT